MAREYEQDDAFGHFVRMISALPFAPPDPMDEKCAFSNGSSNWLVERMNSYKDCIYFIFLYSVGKNQRNATSVTLHSLRQAI